jgi:hypothetical protein
MTSEVFRAAVDGRASGARATAAALHRACCAAATDGRCACRNAPHDSRFTHIPSLEGRAGFWDTVKGWGLGMCQVSAGAGCDALPAMRAMLLHQPAPSSG